MKLPIIIMLALMPLVLTAYAEAPSHVDVYDYPFNITLLEGGNFTLYNYNSHNIYFDGAFSGMVYCGELGGCDPSYPSSANFTLTDQMVGDMTYYLRDQSLYPDTGYKSSITVVTPTPTYVAPPTPTYVTPTPQPIEESIFGEPTLPEVTGIHTWCNSPCSDDVGVSFNSTSSLTLGTFEPITTQPNVSNNTITELKAEIESLKTERDHWKNLTETLIKLLNIQ